MFAKAVDVQRFNFLPAGFDCWCDAADRTGVAVRAAVGVAAAGLTDVPESPELVAYSTVKSSTVTKCLSMSMSSPTASAAPL